MSAFLVFCIKTDPLQEADSPARWQLRQVCWKKIFYSTDSCSEEIQRCGKAGVWKQGCPAPEWRHHSPPSLLAPGWDRLGKSRMLPGHLHSQLCAALWLQGGSRMFQWHSAASTAPGGTKWCLASASSLCASSPAFVTPFSSTAFLCPRAFQEPRLFTRKLLWNWEKRCKAPKETPDVPSSENEPCHCARRHRLV